MTIVDNAMRTYAALPRPNERVAHAHTYWRTPIGVNRNILYGKPKTRQMLGRSVKRLPLNVCDIQTSQSQVLWLPPFECTLKTNKNNKPCIIGEI